MKNGLLDSLWTFRVQSDALRSHQCPEKVMNNIFREYLDHFVIIYLDDILVFSTDIKEHTQHVLRVLSKLWEHGMYAKSEKCEFDRTSVEFLGYVISPSGFWPSLATNRTKDRAEQSG